MHYSILMDNNEIFMQLLGHQAKIDVIDKSGDSLLHHALRLEREYMALRLISRGHDIKFRNMDLK